MLGRGKTTISNELDRNEVAGSYNAQKANTKSQVRRKAAKYQAKKIVTNTKLQDFVDKALMQRQSPEGIAGRLKAGLEPGLPYVSRDTIETYIKSVHGRRIEYQLKVLKAGDKARSKKRKRPTPPSPLTQRLTLNDRIETLQLSAGIFRGVLPIDTGLALVPSVFPGVHFCLESFFVRYPSVLQTLVL